MAIFHFTDRSNPEEHICLTMEKVERKRFCDLSERPKIKLLRKSSVLKAMQQLMQIPTHEAS